MTHSADRPFDWIAALALLLGAAVIAVALGDLLISVLFAAWTLAQHVF